MKGACECVSLTRGHVCDVDDRVTGRLYLQSKIHRHRVWQNLRFWESAVFESISSELSRQSTSSVVGVSQQ